MRLWFPPKSTPNPLFPNLGGGSGIVQLRGDPFFDDISHDFSVFFDEIPLFDPKPW